MRTAADDAPSDADLLAAIGQGQVDAFRRFYERHELRIKLFLSRRTPDSGAVDEAHAATFLAVWMKPEAWRGDGEVAAWLCRIAVHKLLDALNYRARFWRRFQPLRDTDDDRRYSERSAEEELLFRSGVAYGELEAALGQLSPEQREVVDRCILGGLTTLEVARQLRIPQGTVKSRLSGAVKKLRKILDAGSLRDSAKAMQGSRHGSRRGAMTRPQEKLT